MPPEPRPGSSRRRAERHKNPVEPADDAFTSLQNPFSTGAVDRPARFDPYNPVLMIKQRAAVGINRVRYRFDFCDAVPEAAQPMAYLIADRAELPYVRFSVAVQFGQYGCLNRVELIRDLVLAVQNHSERRFVHSLGTL